jgi:cellobiose phosphorylase
MKYGHFTNDGLEFVVTDPLTPRPWINYLTNEEYCAVISHCASGYSFLKDCRSDRILRWLPSSWQDDRPGRYIYVKEKSKIWSLTYQPVKEKPDFYECRHGLGYTKIKTKYNGVSSEITYFVPTNDHCEIWLVSIKNETKKSKQLELFPYCEWLLGDYHLELRYRNIMNLYNRVWFDKQHEAIFAKKTAAWGDFNIQHFSYQAFFASSLKADGYVTRKYPFLGRYNTDQHPEMIFDDKFKNIDFCSGEDAIACFKHKLNLAAGKNKEFVIILGQTQGLPNISHLLTKYRNLNNTKKELDNVKGFWQKKILDNIWVNTPDKDFDFMMNIWVKYQLYICNLWSRSPSYYHEGSGGRGYRDSCQDSESLVSINPEFTRKRIMHIASLIRKDGTSASGWGDTTGPAGHRPNKDHQIWLTATVHAYIRETGDKAILSEYISYLKDKWLKGWNIDVNFSGGATTDGEGTLFEHLERNLNFCFNDVGERGLPHIGHADWNDAIDAAGIKHKGESVWLAQALVRSLKLFAELCALVGDKAKKEEFLNKAKTMSERVNEVCWDGAWYQRGFTDDGTVYGSKVNKEGKIHLNAQSWAILSGISDDAGRTEKIVDSARKYLDGDHGLALFAPAYSEFNPKLGRISMFSQGTKENAAVFCHAATFMIVALLSKGYGDFAYEAMRKIMPNLQKDYELYKTEPYAWSEYLVGPQHPYLYGEGAFTWITGTAGWTFMAATEWLLGARRDFEGLRVDPCIPRHWKKCSIRRPFRGAIYMIEIENPKGKSKGVKAVFVDNQLIDGNVIKPRQPGKTYKVRVVLG